jgi:hypothetical protein
MTIFFATIAIAMAVLVMLLVKRKTAEVPSSGPPGQAVSNGHLVARAGSASFVTRSRVAQRCRNCR